MARIRVKIVDILFEGSYREEGINISITDQGGKFSLDELLRAVAEQTKKDAKMLGVIDGYKLQSDPYVLCTATLPDSNNKFNLKDFANEAVLNECFVCTNIDVFRKKYSGMSVYTVDGNAKVSTGSLAAKSLGSMLSAANASITSDAKSAVPLVKRNML